mmetsp:Transcript_46805/g.105880  ORF Transcript_46805/g.105880 Transcript_46805/m.105880 type:complete len:210 (+) Transcript_46805:506-1135(+)
MSPPWPEEPPRLARWARRWAASTGSRVRTVRSTIDTSAVGTRTAMPVSLPSREGSTFPTALAAPVEAGMRLVRAHRPARQSLPPLGLASTVVCDPVVLWTVVMSPSTIPNSSWMAFASGARQFVVQLAIDTTECSAASYLAWFTPMTSIGVSSLAGAVIMTFCAPRSAPRWSAALAVVVNTPVDSTTYSAPEPFQSSSPGSRLSSKTTR